MAPRPRSNWLLEPSGRVRATVLLQSALMFVLGAAVLMITWHLAPRSIFTTPDRKLSKPTIRFKIKAWCVQAFHSLCISLLHLLRRMKMRKTRVARAHTFKTVCTAPQSMLRGEPPCFNWRRFIGGERFIIRNFACKRARIHDVWGMGQQQLKASR